MKRDIKRIANDVSDEIQSRGLDFGGRFEDVETVLEIALEIGAVSIPENPNKPKEPKGKKHGA